MRIEGRATSVLSKMTDAANTLLATEPGKERLC